MKNLIALFTLATLLFLTSCAKEEIIQPDAVLETVTQIEAKKSIQAKGVEAFETQGVITSVEVTTDEYRIQGNKLVVSFSSKHDFSNSLIESVQQLEFVDQNGNPSMPSFTIDNHIGGNGYLDVEFTIGGNNLTGLDMEVGQGIVVEEIIME